MTQNIYDQKEFFDEYSRLARSIEGLDGAPEWPTLRAMLPAMRGLRVVDLGCGFGWFCRWARENGAARVLGLDVSEKMLERARNETHDPAITYSRTDLERLELPAGEFDLAYSSLAFHYLENIRGLITQLHRALVAGGRLVFSVEHPIFMAPTKPIFSVDAGGRTTWPLDGYLDEGPRTTDWLAKGVVKQHRMVATWINTLVEAGFVIAHLEEWGPTREQVASHPEWADEYLRPSFLMVCARR